MPDQIPPSDVTENPQDPGRRRALRCMAWAGAGVLWTLRSGIPHSQLIGSAEASDLTPGGFSFVQISDSHIGFKKEPNTDPAATLQAAIGKIRTLARRPSLLIHTGDVSQLSKPSEFDVADQIIRGAGLEAHFVPGEHDVLIEDGRYFFDRFAKDSGGKGWYSFDQQGVHFIALVNVLNLRPGGLGFLGGEQLAWLARDLAGRTDSTPIVIFTHMPLWTLYPQWGWGTDDSAEAMALLRRFGSVTVLNGHIHQVQQKIEGNVSFHTAMSTAFPQPAPGQGAGPGPLKVPAGELRRLLGVREVLLIPGQAALAVTDQTLAT